MLLAIDSRGNCIKRVRLSPDGDESLAREWLDGLLEHYDPLPRRPQLRLVRSNMRPAGTLAAGVYLAMNGMTRARQAPRRLRP